MSKPATNPTDAHAEASVLRAISGLATALEKVPQHTLDKWAASTLKDYLALAAALAKFIEHTHPAPKSGNEPITPEALRALEKRLNLIP